jgi:outer membrane protein TolC
MALDLVANYYALMTAIDAIPSSEVFLEASEKAYKGFIAQYRVGTASLLDVLNALTTLSDARAQVVLAKTTWAASLANLAFTVGMLDDMSPFWKTDDDDINK